MHWLLSLPSLLGIGATMALLIWGQRRFGWIPQAARPAAFVAFLLMAGAMLLLVMTLPAAPALQGLRIALLLLAIFGLVDLIRAKARGQDHD